jgi:hypothetical protein
LSVGGTAARTRSKREDHHFAPFVAPAVDSQYFSSNVTRPVTTAYPFHKDVGNRGVDVGGLAGALDGLRER